MKLHRIALTLLIILATTAAVAQSDAQKSFDKLSRWRGPGKGRRPTVNPLKWFTR
jgi:hypothetical protein